MTGKRKMIGFYVTTAVFFVVMLATVIVAQRAGWPVKITELVETYFWAQTIITGGFFTFNGVEHWADKPKK